MIDLRQLIYCKQFDHDVQMRLLQIADSSMWVEDLLDYIGELADKDLEGYGKTCDELEEVEREFGDFKTEIKDLIIDILQDNQSAPLKQEDKTKIYEIDSEFIIPKLSEEIDKILNKKIDLHRKTAKVGGIEIPIDHS